MLRRIRERTFVRRDGTMAHKGPERVERARLRKETRDWLTNKTIPNVREVARDLENAGEDVRDLLAAIDELEALLQEGPAKPRGQSQATAET
ncbi:MAG: hypothetical protein ACREDF_10505 [Thermoplasmata archaeon]